MKALVTERTTESPSYGGTKAVQNFGRYPHESARDLVGSGYHQPERFVPLLARFAHPANAAQRTQLFFQLQRQYGNRYVQRVVSAQRSRDTGEDESKVASETLFRKGSGRALEPGVRAFMEPRFGYDFSNVRVHTDSFATKTAEELSAEAFTIGRDVFFGAGKYNPGSLERERLIAHELTHVVQRTSLKGFIQRQKLAPFEEAEIKPLETIYSETNRAAHSCISILNKAVQTIYKEELKDEKLRSTIQDTMGVLESLNLVGEPTIIEFLDFKGKVTKGTSEPFKLSQSVEELLLGSSAPLNGWYLYGLSVMDGYHSVLIAVHVTAEKKKLYWLDQIVGFKEITGKLDSEIEKKTIGWWKGVKATKGVGYRTRTTFWPFVRVLGDFPMPSKAYV